jgi:nuclear pore complex protein Nup155
MLVCGDPPLAITSQILLTEAGAIRLCLTVAQQRDRANLALAWIKDGAPEQDTRRKEAYIKRTMCYNLVCNVILAVDQVSQSVVDNEMQAANIARRKEEAYGEIDQSEDEVFQTFLYDWYLGQGWSDRLLDLSSPGVVTYLQRKSKDDIAHADLLWRYYAHFHNYFEAAQVQLQLAKSGFDIDLSTRMEYLGRAKANVSTRAPGIQDFGRSKQSRQEVVREITDLLDLAGIQIDILRKLETDPRLSPERKPTIVQALNGQILALDEVSAYCIDISCVYHLTLQ